MIYDAARGQKNQQHSFSTSNHSPTLDGTSTIGPAFKLKPAIETEEPQLEATAHA